MTQKCRARRSQPGKPKNGPARKQLVSFRDEWRCFNASSRKLECHQLRTTLQPEALSQRGHGSLVIACQQFGISCQRFPTEYNAGRHGSGSPSATNTRRLLQSSFADQRKSFHARCLIISCHEPPSPTSPRSSLCTESPQGVEGSRSGPRPPDAAFDPDQRFGDSGRQRLRMTVTDLSLSFARVFARMTRPTGRAATDVLRPECPITQGDPSSSQPRCCWSCWLAVAHRGTRKR